MSETKKIDRLHMITCLNQFFDSEIYNNNSRFCGKTKDDLIYCNDIELKFLFEKMNDIMKYLETRSIFDLKGIFH